MRGLPVGFGADWDAGLERASHRGGLLKRAGQRRGDDSRGKKENGLLRHRRERGCGENLRAQSPIVCQRLLTATKDTG